MTQPPPVKPAPAAMGKEAWVLRAAPPGESGTGGGGRVGQAPWVFTPWGCLEQPQSPGDRG